MRIAIDAMGGDYAPREVVSGAVNILFFSFIRLTLRLSAQVKSSRTINAWRNSRKKELKLSVCLLIHNLLISHGKRLR